MGRINRANLKKTLYYFKRNGVKHTWYAVRERLDERKMPPYRFEPATKEELAQQRRKAEALQTTLNQTTLNQTTLNQATFSIVVPTYRTNRLYLQEMMHSVVEQSYPHWELILADATEDDSVEREVMAFAEQSQACLASAKEPKVWQDKRIRYVRLPENAGIAANTNGALGYVTGEYTGLLDHDDVLTPNALYEMAVRIEEGKKAGVERKMLYSDEDKCNGDMTYFYEPNCKEDFNLDLLLSNNYICHFLVMESGLIKELGFRPEYDGAQDYDLVLRAAEKILQQDGQSSIVHIPKVLYHWRCHTGSTAENPQSKQYAYEAGLRAVQDFADRQGYRAKAVHLRHLGFYALQYEDGVLQARQDVGALGGRIVTKGKNAGGRMTEDGRVYYEGLPAPYSGYLHRVSLAQDAEALDIRCIEVREELLELFKQVTGVSYRKKAGDTIFDVSALPEGTDYKRVSIALSKAIREQGYRLLYEPEKIVTGR